MKVSDIGVRDILRYIYQIYINLNNIIVLNIKVQQKYTIRSTEEA